LKSSSSGIPNRQKAALLGIIGGIAGVLAMQWFQRHWLPVLFPEFQQAPQGNAMTIADPVEALAVIPSASQPGEHAAQTLARLVYEKLTPAPAATPQRRAAFDSAMEWVIGISAGIGYGGTRTTTRWRDIAGAFFMGIRMWIGEIMGTPVFGLRLGPTRYSPKQLLALQIRYWSFTFVMTTVTRILYRLF